jgi:uncharacterized Zn finger protein
MCKHVAAVLYGIGARLDQQPDLLFTLRGVDAKDLVSQAGAGLTQSAKRPKSAKVLDDTSLADVFGIEMATDLPAQKPKAAKKPAKAATVVLQADVAAKLTKKPVAKQALVKAKAPAKSTAKSTAKTAVKSKAKATAEPMATTTKTIAKKPSASRKSAAPK